MLFSWFAKRRRRQILATPFPDAWLEHLQKNVAVYRLLTEAEQAKLRDDLRIFMAEKEWEGCGGLVLTDEMKVTVAAQACLLLLGVEHDYFRFVKTILLYPSAYRAPEGEMGPAGIVQEGLGRAGEAWHRGPVVLAWDSVVAGGQNHRDGHNVVLHEFAHQLDFLDGASLEPAKLDGPAWVRFWMLQVPRQDAVGRLWLILICAAICVGFGFVAPLLAGQPSAVGIICFVLTGVFAFSALWLWLAMKWMDRYGHWPADGQ